MIKNINSFSQIDSIKPNSLVVLDIDDTIMKFQHVDTEWWDKIYNQLLPTYKENTYTQVELLWTDYVSNNKPVVQDKENLYKFLDTITIRNCQLILLTARDKSISLLTTKHLKECGIDMHWSRIFYSRNKGSELKYIVSTIFPEIQNIIFVDDLIENLIDIQTVFNTVELSKYNLELYKIKHKL
jgi:hypothetical protein